MKYELRKCTYDDLDLVFELKKLGLKWYVEKIYGWEDSSQLEMTKKELDKYIEDTNVIICDNKEVGITAFHKYKDYYCVGFTLIHPDYRNKGLATTLISKYIECAKKDKKNIVIKTYKYNPARNLYSRLGFNVYDEDKTHVYMNIDFSK